MNYAAYIVCRWGDAEFDVRAQRDPMIRFLQLLDRIPTGVECLVILPHRSQLGGSSEGALFPGRSYSYFIDCLRVLDSQQLLSPVRVMLDPGLKSGVNELKRVSRTSFVNLIGSCLGFDQADISRDRSNFLHKRLVDGI